MKKINLIIIVFVIGTFFNKKINAQTDTLGTDNIVVEERPQKKPYKRVSDFKIYGGISTSKIQLSNSSFESAYSAGYNLGISFRKGRFGYWEIGIKYNGSTVVLENVSLTNPLSEQTMGIGQIDFPLSAGINLLSMTRRVLGIRLFTGIIPGTIVRVGSNDFELSEDDFNSFQFDGHAGLGVDIAFLFLEGGYQYGFTDLLKEQDSNLSQLYLNLGFRF